MVRARPIDASTLVLTMTKDSHNVLAGFDWPFDTTGIEMPDAAGSISQTFWPDITTEATVGFTDDMSAVPVDCQRGYTQGVRNDVPAAKTRKPKAPTLRDSDWEPYKPRILELYGQRNMDAQSVQRALLEESGFFAEYDYLTPQTPYTD